MPNSHGGGGEGADDGDDSMRRFHETIEDDEERAHVYSVLDSFRRYRDSMHHTMTHVRRQAFYALPASHWQKLAGPPVRYLDKLDAIDDAIDQNATVAEAVYRVALGSVGLHDARLDADDNGADETESPRPPWHGTATQTDLDKAQSTVHQFMRDWSAEGAAERDPVFTPIFDDLARLMPSTTDSLVQPCADDTEADADAESTSRPPRVLIPGAGLGRLVFELFIRGYRAEGNDLSYHQTFASALALNFAPVADCFSVYPFVRQMANLRARADALRHVSFPDVCPADELGRVQGQSGWKGEMSMSAGDFVEVYGPGASAQAGQWDAVVTLFFIDTAPDVLTYIETVRHCLRRGGVWINVGPLLWHFSPPPASGSRETDDAEDRKPQRDRIGSHGVVELAHDEVMALLAAEGFEILLEDLDPDGKMRVRYQGNDRSMQDHVYAPVHWVARKL